MIKLNLLAQDLRILVTRTDRLGDLVLSTPVFEALRRKFPKASISALVFQENREVGEGAVGRQLETEGEAAGRVAGHRDVASG